MIKTLLFLALGAFAAAYVAVLARAVLRQRGEGRPVGPSWLQSAIGFVTNFFDTLGIGSFAPTTSAFKFWKQVDDRVIPGTLNVGHTLPTIAQAFIFIAIVTVDLRTLVLLIASSVAGSWLGAGVVAKWPRRAVQVGMGTALLGFAGLMLMTAVGLGPAGGEAIALTGSRLWIGVAGNFALGALMTLGIGLYAPCLVMISLLGMSPVTAFPIMMGSCAFLMPVGSIRFMREGSYDLRASLGLGLAGVPAVLLAAFVVKSLPIPAVRWLVVAVATYAALSMLLSARREAAARQAPVAVPAD